MKLAGCSKRDVRLLSHEVGERSSLRRSGSSQLALVAITLSWGSSLSLQKLISPQIGPVLFNAARCGAALVALAIVCRPDLRRLSWRQAASCLATGAVLGLSILLQSLALSATKANICGFISGLPVVITPVFALLMLGERPGRSAALGVVLAGLGVVLISGATLSLQAGDGLALLASVGLALHIVLTGRLSRAIEPRSIATLQMAGATVVCSLACPFAATGFVNASAGAWLITACLGVMNLGVATLVQAWAQQRCSAARTGVILTMEPVFGAIFAWQLLGETLDPRALLGAAASVVAMILPRIPVGVARSIPFRPAPHRRIADRSDKQAPLLAAN